MRFISQLENALIQKSNAENGITTSKYVRNKFDFFGIKTSERRQLLKAIWKERKKENKQEVAANTRPLEAFLF
jgi:3-methyladenine DNA glycosylase AlkD